MKKYTFALMAALLVAVVYYLGFRQGRYGRPFTYEDPPSEILASTGIDGGIPAFYRTRGPIYLSWSKEYRCFVAQTKSSDVFQVVTNTTLLRYNPANGEPIDPKEVIK